MKKELSEQFCVYQDKLCKMRPNFGAERYCWKTYPNDKKVCPLYDKEMNINEMEEIIDCIKLYKHGKEDKRKVKK